MTTLETYEVAPVAVALLDAAGAIERSTALFSDRFGRNDAILSRYRAEIETLVAGGVDRLTMTLDGTEAEISAVVDPEGHRHALLTVPHCAPATPGERRHALLDEPIDASPAIVWLKDMDGRYMRVNRRYTEVLHTEAERVCGKTDAELSPNESIEGARLRANDLVPEEPLELEYTVAAFDSRPAFSVLRFALRDDDDQPIAVCGVAAPVAQARVAQSECERLMRIEPWGRVDESAVRRRLLAEWALAPAGAVNDGGAESAPALDHAVANGNGTHIAQAADEASTEQVGADGADGGADEIATVSAERDAALARSAELEESLSRAQTSEHHMVETFRVELAAAQQELERVRGASREAPTPHDLEAERRRAREASVAAEQAHAEAASMTADLLTERHTVESLEAELHAAHEELHAQQARAEQAEADAAASSAALADEQQTVQTLQTELTTVRDELDRAQQAVAERPTPEQLEQQQARAEQAEADAAASSAALADEQQTIQTLRTELTTVRDELDRAQEAVTERPTPEQLEQQQARAEQAEADAAASSAALADEQQTVQTLRTELTTVRDELDRAQQLAAEAAANAHVQEELDEERARAARAEAALDEQRARAERAIAFAEQAEREAAVIAQQADAAAALLAQAEAAADDLAVKEPVSTADEPVNTVDEPVNASVEWDAASQRALSAALSGVSEWRAALDQVVKTLGAHGVWDAVVAWCPGGRPGLMKCTAMWTRPSAGLSGFETRTWQHWQDLSRAEFRGANDEPGPTCVLSLATAEDGLLRAAAEAGMGSAVLVPIHDGRDLLAIVELLSPAATAPRPELMVNLEGIALQLGTVAHLLNVAAQRHWRMDRL